jgi:hypothetical protein
MLLSSGARRSEPQGHIPPRRTPRSARGGTYVHNLTGPAVVRRPRAVVAGHKNKDRPDDPAILGETRQYLQDVIRLLDDKPAAREFYDQLTGLYPDRLNPGVVWLGARGLLGE